MSKIEQQNYKMTQKLLMKNQQKGQKKLSVNETLPQHPRNQEQPRYSKSKVYLSPKKVQPILRHDQKGKKVTARGEP